MPGAARAAAEAADDLVITHYRLSPPSWPKGQRLTITVVADLHAGSPNMGRERVRQVVDAANALRSDLTVVLGDFFATHRFVTERVPHPVWAAEFSGLHAPLGVYSILGNHDWWHDVDNVLRALDKVRLPVMQKIRFYWVHQAAVSGLQVSAIRLPIGWGQTDSGAWMTCPALWHASTPTIP